MERAKVPAPMLYGAGRRIWELDFFRGVCVLLMILYHTMFDLRMFSHYWANLGEFYRQLNEISTAYFLSPALHLQDFLAPVFFFIAGISDSLTRNSPMRFTKVIVAAFIVTFSAGLMNTPITIGVLHCLGYCMLLYYLMEKLCKDDRCYLALAVTLCVTMLAIRACDVYLYGRLYISDYFPWKAMPLFEYIGIPFRSHSDYYPISPWFGIFLLGVLFGKNVYARDKRSLLPRVRSPFFAPVEWIGRHAIWIYLLHQPLIYGAFWLINSILLFSPAL